MLAAAIAVVAVALGAVFVTGVNAGRAGFDLIGHRHGPVVVSTSNLYFALSDMDAQVANVLLVADATNLGITRQKALDIYAQRRSEVSGYLQQTSAIAGDDEAAAQQVRAVLDQLGRYEALAAQVILVEEGSAATPGRPSPQALDLYRQATDLMHTDLLPAAQRLVASNATALEGEYGSVRASLATSIGWVVGLGIAVLLLLLGLQVYLVRRCHRVLNPAIAVATIAGLVLLVVGVTSLTSAREQLRVAKKDAFDSVYALSQARAISYDANADESRYLLDPARAAVYEKAFADKTRQLVDLGPVGLGAYDAALAQALARYDADRTVAFDGRYGTALRNITFAGERDAAELTLRRFQDYQRADRKIRALNTSGNLAEAIRFCVSYSPGDSNALFDGYDTALVSFTGINDSAFGHAIDTGEAHLAGWGWSAPASLAAVMALILVGLRPRWAEYRA
jgi:hypothetical protein